jgi:hypothetical protein
MSTNWLCAGTRSIGARYASDVGALALLLAAAACTAAPVQAQPDGGLTVRVGPLVGAVTAYDSVGGRFSLRVGTLRTRGGLSQKIPWFAARGASVGETLTVTGRALTMPRTRTFTQIFRSAQEVGGEQRTMFPTVIAPSSAGCWVLTFATGATRARLAVLVRPRPTD